MYPSDWDFYSILGIPGALLWKEHKEGFFYNKELATHSACNISNYVCLYFQKQVLRCVAAWMDWAVYTPDFLYDLQNIFLGQGEKSNQSEVMQMSI